MPSEVTIINLGGVNCYLLKAGDGFVLVDTGFQTQRAKLEQRLEEAGCKPGKLELIILTHGDSDHAGNCAYLRQRYGAPIAIHKDDASVVETGDTAASHKLKPDKRFFVFRLLVIFTKRLAERYPLEKFKPDFTVDEGFDLVKYALQARVLHIPGHSKGSIGVLTDDGDLFCGDMFYNMPGFSFIDDMEDYKASLAKLKNLSIKTIYPGHGRPFTPRL